MKITNVTKASLLLFASLLGIPPTQADNPPAGPFGADAPPPDGGGTNTGASATANWFFPGVPMVADPVSDYGDGPAGLTILTTADMNDDGYPDIAAAHGYRKAGIYLQTGARTFAPEHVLSEPWWPVAAQVGATSIATGDLDQDGAVDLVIPLYGNHYFGRMVQLYRGLGDGTFEIWPVDGYDAKTKGEGKDGINDGIIAARGAANPMFPLIADFNDDGLTDVAVSGNNGSWSVDILTQAANRNFAVSDVDPAGQNPQYMALADFNEDGYPDLAAGALYTGALVFLNDGTAQGTIHRAGGTLLSPYHHFLVTADFNGDGHQDIAVRALRETFVDILYGSGSGAFSKTARFRVSGTDGYLAAGDIDNDGDADLVVASVSTRSVDLLLNDDSGSFGAAISTALSAAPWGIAVADFDQDDHIDVAVSRRDDTVQVLWNVGPQKPPQPNAISVAPSAIRLSWKHATGAKAYRIQSRLGQCDSSGGWAVRADVGANILSLLDTGLLPASPYSYRVSAYTGLGFTEPSPCVSAITAAAGTPHIPARLRVYSRSDERIDLHWQDTSINETAFDIYRQAGSGNWTLLDSVPGDRQSYSDAAANGNSTTVSYSYDVRACNASGCSGPNRPTAAPFRPTRLAAKVGSAVRLRWKDNSNDESYFHVERRNGDCASDTPWSLLKVVPPNTHGYKDDSAVSGVEYAYRVRAGSQTSAPPMTYGWSRYTGCVAVTAP